jgi:hypothetical protein
MMRRYVRFIGFAAALATLPAVFALAGVAQADPAGTKILGPATTGRALATTVFGATPTAVVVGSAAGVTAVAVNGTTHVAIPGASPSDRFFGPAGNVFIDDTLGKWYDLSGVGVGGQISSGSYQRVLGAPVVAAGPAGPILLLANAAGSGVPASTQVLEENVDPSGPTVLLGTIAGRDITKPEVIGGASGVAVLDMGSSPIAGFYLSYSKPGATPVSLNVGSWPQGSSFTCTSITSNALGCIEPAGGSPAVLRVPLTGAAPTVLALTTAVQSVVVTPQQTVVLESGSGFGDYALIGSAMSSTTTKYSAIAADPRGHVFGYSARDEPVATAGLYELPSSYFPGSRTELLPGQPEPYVASLVSSTSGRVAWTANTLADPSQTQLWNVTGASTTPSLVDTTPSSASVSTSSGRTAFGIGDGLQVDDVFGGEDLAFPTVRFTASSPVSGEQISGNRVLLAGNSSLLDLATGKFTSLTTLGIAGAGAVALWGNYLTYGKPDGTIWREDLSTSAAPVELATGLGATPSVWAWGDWVAYCGRGGCSLRNARTMASAVQLPVVILGLTSDGVLGSAANYQLVRYGTTSPLTTVTLTGVTTSTKTVGLVSVDGSVVSWIGPDGRPRTAPVAHVADQPRSLGDPIAPKSLAPGASWTLDLPTSAQLTSCSVNITSGTTVIRTLPCDTPQATIGTVVATWTTPAQTPAGTYTWTVVAANADGPLLAANGTTAATTGTITLT